MSHIQEAKELKHDYPEYTSDYTWYEVMVMWEEYSESYDAGWLIPDKNTVAYVFS